MNGVSFYFLGSSVACSAQVLKIFLGVELLLALGACRPKPDKAVSPSPSARVVVPIGEPIVVSGVPKVTCEAVHSWQQSKKKMLLVDVRAREPFDSEHISGAVNRPWAVLNETSTDLPRNHPIIFYCACPDDHSSIGAAETMRDKHGYRNVYVMTGGLREWREKGYPLTQKKQQIKSGADLYVQHCAGCHGLAGQGMKNEYPPMAKDPIINALDPEGAINITLYGLMGRPIQGKRYDAAMPHFHQLLNDHEVASLLTHVRTHYGNQARAVTPADVRRQRLP